MNKGKPKKANFVKDNEYYTPKNVVRYFGEFEYDPATTKEKALEFGVSNYDTIETNGLTKDWSKYKKIWINPPFTEKYDGGERMKKVDEEGNCYFAYLNYMNSLERKDLLEYAIGADLLSDKLQKRIDEAIEIMSFGDRALNYSVDYIRLGRNKYDKLMNTLKGADKE